MVRIFILLLILCFSIQNPSFAKKKKVPPQRMVETKEEWYEQAKNINLEERKIPEYKELQDKDFKPKAQPPKKFVKYNSAPGSREVDLSKIKRLLDIRSQGVFDPDFKYIAYGQYYYTPVYNQISSDIFVQELKSGFTRIKKALSVNILNVNRTPVISSGIAEFRKDMFSTLTIVDFSRDSSKLLVKEKVGSSNSGIFRNYVWIYFMPKGDTAGFSTRYDELNDTIKYYWGNKGYLALDNYRWDLKPLGFSEEKPNMVVVEAFAWDKQGEKIYLGLWGIETDSRKILLLSEKPMQIKLSINALILKEYLP